MDTIFKTPTEVALLKLCESSLEPHGFRVVEVDCRVGGRSLVRVYIDHLDSSPVSMDDCVAMTRILDPLLETGIDLPGAYDLEVSSPGFDRRLRVTPDFETAVGKEVKLSLRETVPGVGANVRALLERLEPGKVWLKHNGKPVSIEFNNIKKAQCIWDS